MTIARTGMVTTSLFWYRDGGRQKVQQEGRCRMCRSRWPPEGVRLPTRHHIVPQWWFASRGLGYKLRDAEANILPLCVQCHREVEMDEWARRMMRKVLAPVEVAFALRVAREEWVDERYPRTRLSAHAVC